MTADPQAAVQTSGEIRRSEFSGWKRFPRRGNIFFLSDRCPLEPVDMVPIRCLNTCMVSDSDMLTILPARSWMNAPRLYLRIVEKTDDLPNPDKEDLKVFDSLINVWILEIIHDANIAARMDTIIGKIMDNRPSKLHKSRASTARNLRNQMKKFERLKLIKRVSLPLYFDERLPELEAGGKVSIKEELDRLLKMEVASRHDEDQAGPVSTHICGLRPLRELVELVKRYPEQRDSGDREGAAI